MKRKIIRLSGLLLIAVLIVVGLGGCSLYPENNDDLSAENAENTGDTGNTAVVENADADKYAVVFNDGGRYIVGQTAGGNWQEILKVDNTASLIGFYDNKLYFCDEMGLAYIDFSITDFSRVPWMNHPEPEPWGLKFSSGMLVNDTMYFNYNTFEGGNSKTDGIFTLKLKDTSFDDAVQLISSVSFFWQIERASGTIYFLKTDSTKTDSLCGYDLATGSETLLFENVKSFKLYRDGVILYYTTNGELYLYDTETGNNQLIFDKLDSNSGTIWSCADYRNGDVYYKNIDQIIKYNNGNRDIIYTYASAHGGDYFYGFEFLKDDIIELVLQSVPNKYLINGEVLDNLPESEQISVTMSDGTTELFNRLYLPE